jgi:site-specific DNA-cytosine methylase
MQHAMGSCHTAIAAQAVGDTRKRARDEDGDEADAPLARPRTKLRTGSICSGLDIQNCSFEDLRVPIDERFGCELDKKTRLVLLANHSPAVLFTDVTHDSFIAEAEPVDFLTAGFPCQSFSSDGDRRGWFDLRGQVVYYILAYIKKHLPTP